MLRRPHPLALLPLGNLLLEQTELRDESESVSPSHSALAAGNRRDASLGPWFSSLSDQWIVEQLLAGQKRPSRPTEQQPTFRVVPDSPFLLSERDLFRLATVCKAFYALICAVPDSIVWRDRCVFYWRLGLGLNPLDPGVSMSSWPLHFAWAGSWRQTCGWLRSRLERIASTLTAAKVPAADDDRAAIEPPEKRKKQQLQKPQHLLQPLQPQQSEQPQQPQQQQDHSAAHWGAPASLQLEHFYSDYLFQPWFCLSMGFKPGWLGRSNIPRRPAGTGKGAGAGAGPVAGAALESGLSLAQFIAEFEQPGEPVILTGLLAEQWPAFGKWSRDWLVANFGDRQFTAGPLELPLHAYFEYCDSHTDDQPLYVFDKRFDKRVPELLRDYSVPIYFQEDLFRLLGDEPPLRPDYRWIIIGPAHSGSGFHVDPNGTSAWNAVLTGRKKW